MPRFVVQVAADGRVIQFDDCSEQDVSDAMRQLCEYSDSQLRDDHGRWSDQGGGDGRRRTKGANLR